MYEGIAKKRGIYAWEYIDHPNHTFSWLNLTKQLILDSLTKVF